MRPERALKRRLRRSNSSSASFLNSGMRFGVTPTSAGFSFLVTSRSLLLATARMSGRTSRSSIFSRMVSPAWSRGCRQTTFQRRVSVGAIPITAGMSCQRGGSRGGWIGSRRSSTCLTGCGLIISGGLRPTGKFRPLRRQPSAAIGSRPRVRLCWRPSLPDMAGVAYL